MKASVIIYTYDRRAYIRKALESVINQSVPRESFEVIVVKGFSDPDLDRYIDSAADRNLVVDEVGHGLKISAGIRASSGDVIFILDDDDEFESGRMKEVLAIFSDDPEVNFVHNSIHRIDDDGKESAQDREKAPGKIMTVFPGSMTRKELSALIRYRASWYSSCMAFRRKVLEDNLELLEQVTQSIDPAMFLMALRSGGKIVLIPERLTRYRVHSSTTNYRLPLKEFLERKEKFYRNSSETFSKVAMKDLSIRYILDMRDQMDFLAILHSWRIGRGELIRATLRYCRTFRSVLNRYQVLWLAFGLVRMLSSGLAVKFYYETYLRSLRL